jgi:hypothetical protein
MTTFKNVIVTVIVAAVVAFGVASLAVSATTGKSLGASASQVQSVLWQFTNGISLDPGNSSAGGNGDYVFTKGGTIPAGANQAVWINKTGRTVYVDYADVITTGIASSSMRVSAVATSSVSTSTLATTASSMWLTAPIANPAGGLLIDNVQIGTSSPKNTIINTDVGPGTNASGTIPVADGSGIIFSLRQNNPNNCTGSACEQATSTNRGFNLTWFLEGHYQP